MAVGASDFGNQPNVTDFDCDCGAKIYAIKRGVNNNTEGIGRTIPAFRYIPKVKTQSLRTESFTAIKTPADGGAKQVKNVPGIRIHRYGGCPTERFFLKPARR
jgi:hypothetical protein